MLLQDHEIERSVRRQLRRIQRREIPLGLLEPGDALLESRARVRRELAVILVQPQAPGEVRVVGEPGVEQAIRQRRESSLRGLPVRRGSVRRADSGRGGGGALAGAGAGAAPPAAARSARSDTAPDRHPAPEWLLSPRGGALECEVRGDRVAIAGRAVKYLEGQIIL